MGTYWLLLLPALFEESFAIQASNYRNKTHYPADSFTVDQINHGAAVLYFLGLLYMFFGIMQVHRLYLEPCLHLFSKTKTFDDDTMDSTIRPIAVSAPESLMCLFATFFGVTDVGISSFLGTNAFTACIERGAFIFIAGAIGEIDWYTSFRDIITYVITLFATAMLLLNSTIAPTNSILMLLIFFIYWMFMKFNHYVEKFARQTARLNKKFKVGPRFTDAQILEAQSLSRREFEYTPESFMDQQYKYVDGFVVCSFLNVTGM